MTWKAPVGTAPASKLRIGNAIASAVARKQAEGLTKAAEFLDGEVKESWRVFISTFIQHSTAAHLSLGDLLAGRYGSLLSRDDWIKVRKKALVHYFGPSVEDFAFEYYAATQVLFPALRRKITLYRGIARNTAQLMFSDLAIPGYQAYLNLNPLSSWSDAPELPVRFAKRGGGAVVKLSLDPEHIFAYWRHDGLLESVLTRQCHQHIGKGPAEVGGEAIVWCPNGGLPIKQEDIYRDFTQIPPQASLGLTEEKKS